MTEVKKNEPVQLVEELKDEQLDQAEGGIIAILIGLAKDPKQPGGANIALGDGSVRT